MNTSKRLTGIAAVTVTLASGCAGRELPNEPLDSPPVITAPPQASGAVSAAASLIAIEDALDRVIPALSRGGDAVDALP
jgi:hypothetical protein